VVIYDISPATFLGRVFAFVFIAMLLVTVFFLSLLVFSILLTTALLFIVYVWWASRHIGRKGTKIKPDGGEPPHPEEQGCDTNEVKPPSAAPR
jgi:ABC-type bacteriocin/lantibiotic exporter with double-glycine peptidase domain